MGKSAKIGRAVNRLSFLPPAVSDFMRITVGTAESRARKGRLIDVLISSAVRKKVKIVKTGP